MTEMRKKKKVLCLGNMNNNFFSLARYLKDAGYEVGLRTMLNEPAHFGPSADSYTNDYESYTQRIRWSNMPSDYTGITRKQIKEDIGGYDYFIGCGASPAFFHKAGIKLDIFIPYGSDLDVIPFLRRYDYQKRRKLFKRWRLAVNQRKGIENASYVLFDYTNDDCEAVFKRFDMKGERLLLSSPLLYLPEYSLDNINKYAQNCAHYRRFQELRAGHSFIAFHHSGHWWKDLPTELFYKGSDKIIEGFAQFVKDVPDALLVLFEYGGDFEESKKLVKKLGIENNVAWFPKMPRKEIMLGLSMCDVGIGEISRPWIMYGTISEMMAMAKPIVMNQADAASVKAYKTIYPVQQATNSEEVAAGLKYYHDNPDKAKQDGDANHRWITEELIQTSLDKIISLIEAE